MVWDKAKIVLVGLTAVLFRRIHCSGSSSHWPQWLFLCHEQARCTHVQSLYLFLDIIDTNIVGLYLSMPEIGTNMKNVEIDYMNHPILQGDF